MTGFSLSIFLVKASKKHFQAKFSHNVVNELTLLELRKVIQLEEEGGWIKLEL